jgi:pimeloyl-ACP methyl ester carboxylesterase
MLPPSRSHPHPCAIDTRRLRSFDGTEIAYHVAGASGGPSVVLASGLGAPFAVWRALVAYLGDRYRFVGWDYRGLHGSARPSSDTAYTVLAHARDLEAVVAAERIDRASFVGAGLGVQVVLDAFARQRGRAHDLVLISGSWGRPFDALSPVPAARPALPRLVDLARRVYGLGPKRARRGLPVAWLRRLGLIGDTLDDATLAELSRAFDEIDLDAWLRSLAAAGHHDAGPVLATVNVPALVIAGDRDRFAPRGLAQQMARRIADAEILVVPGGTHSALLEYPELVILRIERFWRERGF